MKVKKIIFIPIPVFIYLCSLFLPCYAHNEFHAAVMWEEMFGWECLTSGFFAVAYASDYHNPFPFISWISNLVYATGLVLLIFAKRPQSLKITSRFLLAALIMSAGCLVTYQGGKNHFTPLYGCAAWMSSYLILWTGSLLAYREAKSMANAIA